MKVYLVYGYPQCDGCDHETVLRVFRNYDDAVAYKKKIDPNWDECVFDIVEKEVY